MGGGGAEYEIDGVTRGRYKDCACRKKTGRKVDVFTSITSLPRYVEVTGFISHVILSFMFYRINLHVGQGDMAIF